MVDSVARLNIFYSTENYDFRKICRVHKQNNEYTVLRVNIYVKPCVT